MQQPMVLNNLQQQYNRMAGCCYQVRKNRKRTKNWCHLNQSLKARCRPSQLNLRPVSFVLALPLPETFFGSFWQVVSLNVSCYIANRKIPPIPFFKVSGNSPAGCAGADEENVECWNGYNGLGLPGLHGPRIPVQMDVQVTYKGDVILLPHFVTNCKCYMVLTVHSSYSVESADRGYEPSREPRFRYGFSFIYLDEYVTLNGSVCTTA